MGHFILWAWHQNNTPLVVVTGCVVAGDVYQGGTIKSALYQGGIQRGDTYQGGMKTGQAGCCDG